MTEATEPDHATGPDTGSTTPVSTESAPAETAPAVAEPRPLTRAEHRANVLAGIHLLMIPIAIFGSVAMNGLLLLYAIPLLFLVSAVLMIANMTEAQKEKEETGVDGILTYTNTVQSLAWFGGVALVAFLIFIFMRL